MQKSICFFESPEVRFLAFCRTSIGHVMERVVHTKSDCEILSHSDFQKSFNGLTNELVGDIPKLNMSFFT